MTVHGDHSARDGRGILYPARLPSLHREAAPDALLSLVRWFWIPRWNLAPGRTSRQELLPFPASNLVVDEAGVTIAGPTTRASVRDLEGSGWVVGALLRPAGIAALSRAPREIRDDEVPFSAPELHRAVAGAMTDPDSAACRAAATEAFTAWALEHLEPADESGLAANAMEDLIAGDRSVVRVDQVAEHLSLSARSVQRLADRHVGLPPLAIIRRYRLQEAAQRLRDDPEAGIAEIAAELGYADQSHLTTDFRQVLGFTPGAYRRDPAREARDRGARGGGR